MLLKDNNISLIIVTYNGIPWLSKCLERIKSYPVIVVDNNSTDNSVKFIQQNYPNIKIFLQKRNLGFGEANNIGISYALENGARHVFLLNQDAYLELGCIEKLIEVQIKFPEYGILSPLQLNGQGNRLDQNFSQYLNFQANPDFYSDYVLGKPKKEIYDVPFVNAAGWLISKSCVEKVGGFDPIFFHYGEDDNYCQRVHYHGFKIGIIPDAKLLHDRENRFSQERLYSKREYFQVMERQLKLKHGDINKPQILELENLILKRRNAWLKTTLKLDLNNASLFKKEYLMLKRIKSEIIKSIIINKSPGLNYLK